MEVRQEDYFNLFDNEMFYKFLIERYPWATDYAYYYIWVCYAPRRIVPIILESILQEDYSHYSPEKAYAYLQKCEKNNLNICVIIPTCNRASTIAYLLTVAAPLYRRFGVDVIIYDGSTDEKTLNVVNKFRGNGYYNVLYKPYTGKFDGFSLDHKVIKAYEEFADQYEYIWICRDGLIPIIDEIYEKIRYYSKQKVGCIIVDTKSRNGNLEIEKEYSKKDDCDQFLEEQACRLQTLGMLILSSEFAKKLIKEIVLDDNTYSLWQMAAPFHYFALHPYRVVFFTRNVFAPNIKANAKHFWSDAEKALEQWSYRWNYVIDHMPDSYGNSKQKCKMIYTIDFHPFKVKNILEMRGWGGLNFMLVKRYRDSLKKTTRTPQWCFTFISIMPKFIARFCYQLIMKYPKMAHRFHIAILGNED